MPRDAKGNHRYAVIRTSLSKHKPECCTGSHLAVPDKDGATHLLIVPGDHFNRVELTDAKNFVECPMGRTSSLHGKLAEALLMDSTYVVLNSMDESTCIHRVVCLGNFGERVGTDSGSIKNACVA